MQRLDVQQAAHGAVHCGRPGRDGDVTIQEQVRVQGRAGAGGLEAAGGEGGLLRGQHALARRDEGLQEGFALGGQRAAGGRAQAGEAEELHQQLHVLVELAVQLAHLARTRAGRGPYGHTKKASRASKRILQSSSKKKAQESQSRSIRLAFFLQVRVQSASSYRHFDLPLAPNGAAGIFDVCASLPAPGRVCYLVGGEAGYGGRGRGRGPDGLEHEDGAQAAVLAGHVAHHLLVAPLQAGRLDGQRPPQGRSARGRLGGLLPATAAGPAQLALPGQGLLQSKGPRRQGKRGAAGSCRRDCWPIGGLET